MPLSPRTEEFEQALQVGVMQVFGGMMAFGKEVIPNGVATVRERSYQP